MDNETREEVVAEIAERSHGEVPSDIDEIIEMAEDIADGIGGVECAHVLAVWIQEMQAER